MRSLAFVNGKFSSLEEAKVSVEDRGFLFGDGIYDVIRVRNGRPYKLEKHLKRTFQCAKELEIPIPYSKDELLSIMTEIIRKSGIREAKLYLQITRGAYPRAHEFPQEVKPTFVLIVREYNGVDEVLIREGAKAITYPDIRWGRCDLKSLNLLPNVLARQKAVQMGAYEAIFHKGDGHITEGAITNVFIVKKGTVLTAPESREILSGVTRETVIKIAREKGIEVRERVFSLEELYNADEVFITGTTTDLLSVVEIDGKVIGKGKPGEISSSLYKALKEDQKNECNLQ